jgi:hypothetical protein
MASTQHYTWAAGHGILLLSTLRYLLAYVTFKSAAYVFWYRFAFVGAILSYAIVCYKSMGTPQRNMAYLQRALADENVQYFGLAIYWLTVKPIPIALVPYAIFSLFHTLTFLRTTVIPKALGSGGAPATGSGTPTHPLSKKLQSWIKANYDYAMQAVAYTEVAILVRVVLGLFFFQNSFLTPILFAHFLRQRYYHSTFTREVLASLDARVTGLLANPSIPPIAVTVYTQAKGMVGKWAGSALQPQAPQGAAPRRASRG